MSFDSKWNAQLSAYNVTESSLRRAKAAISRGNTSTTPSKIVCLGDSITQGVTSTPQRLFNWPYRLRQLLAADGRAGTVGEGAAFNTGQTPASYDERWTAGTGWGKVSGGLLNASMYQAAPGSGTLSFAIPSGVDTAEIYYVRHSINGTWTYNVDGGSSTGVNANGSTTSLKTGAIALGSTAGHTLNITPHATTGYAMITGVGFYNSAARNNVEVITGGALSGQTAGQMNTGSTNNTSFGNFDTLAAISPELVIICFGRNDAGSSAITSYTTNMQATIDLVKTTLSKDCLLITPPPASVTTYYANATMRQKLYALADANDCALLDLERKFGSSWASAPLSLSGDSLHPNDAGQHALAQAVSNLLLNG